ncbi:cytidylate kinase [Desulfosalsimonas propionicica]|uniref:Cytidylate kinase n=1 Tax=Desulfosalsimonas propionicica TaxID=332175 RepID=A0A7W0HJL0_9BACT|nr:cytidylate kinase-like family protein [Desulfosalsimonas propionicica]MBA2880176.1 cytidylate kinase [Desulfosalsimonas propionicica]
MAIITISRGCFSHGKEVAEKTAEILGYKILSRETLIEEANQRYNVPEKELIQSIHDAPSVLERFTRGKEKYLSYIQAVLLEHAKDDNIVYHGHGSHILLPDISHVLNIRIIADLADRIDFMREKHNISEKEAISYINEEDNTRARWAHYLYKVDLTNPHSYAMTIRIKRMKVTDAAETICHAARRKTFVATPDSRKAIGDLALSSRVKAAIENYCKPDLKVSVNATSGIVYIKAETQNVRKSGYTSFKTEEYLREKTKKEITDEIGTAINGIPGIENVLYDIEPPSYT